MRSRRRRGQSLIEAAVVLPVLLAATFALFAGVEVAAWKLTGDAAAGAGSAVLAAGGSPAQAVQMTRRAFHAPSSFTPIITAGITHGAGTVDIVFVVPAPLGPVHLGATRTVVVPSAATGQAGGGGGGGSGGGGFYGGGGPPPGNPIGVCDHVVLSPTGRLICTGGAGSVP